METFVLKVIFGGLNEDRLVLQEGAGKRCKPVFDDNGGGYLYLALALASLVGSKDTTARVDGL